MGLVATSRRGAARHARRYHDSQVFEGHFGWDSGVSRGRLQLSLASLLTRACIALPSLQRKSGRPS
eukprot:748103-Pyramimonas_sp.AAC.1